MSSNAEFLEEHPQLVCWYRSMEKNNTALSSKKWETLLESCCNFVKQIPILFPNFLTSLRLEGLTML